MKTTVQINDDFRFAIDELQYVLEQRVTSIDSKTKQEKKKWKLVGYYSTLVPMFKRVVLLATKADSQKHEVLTMKEYLAYFKKNDEEMKTAIKVIGESLQ